jgi:hypothetical protein
MQSERKLFTGFEVRPTISDLIFSSTALTQVRQQRALEDASKWAGTRITNRDAIPGMMLHVALFNMFSESLVSFCSSKFIIFQATRKAAFLLLCKLRETYHLHLPLPSNHTDIPALYVPSNLRGLAVTVSGGPNFAQYF